MDFLRGTTPEGTIYIDKSKILAISETNIPLGNGLFVKCYIWVGVNDEDRFNMLEDVETIRAEL